MEQIWSIWESGGWVMIPLFTLAFLLYAQGIHLFLWARNAHFDRKNEARWWAWVEDPDKAEGTVKEVIQYVRSGSLNVANMRSRFDEIRLSTVAKMDRRTTFLAMLVAAAPLLGLLGTVLGMLQTFFGISTSGGTETAGVVAAGISEALVTTQTGLTIALPGLFLVMMIRRKRQNFEIGLARLESLMLSRHQAS